MKKTLTILLAFLLMLQLTACGEDPLGTSEATTTEEVTTVAPTTKEVTTEEPTTEETTTEEETTEETTEAEPDPMDVYKDSEFAPLVLDHYIYGTDYESLYDTFGRKITIADVSEDAETGFAYLEADGKKYLLGLDFLSMAMIYNTEPAGTYETKEDVYAAWWRYYVKRWNYLLPEIPLYTNGYYCFYNTNLTGVEEHPLSASWSVLDALIEWGASNGTLKMGSTTKAAGQFRYAGFGNAATNPADNEIFQLISGLETVSRTKNAGYTWNDTVVKAHEETLNEDGSMTYTITLHDDLKFSDGSKITAKDYLAFPMVFFSPLAEAASGRQNSGTIYSGWDEYLAYTGPDGGTGSKVFTGLHLLDEYSFSLTVRKEYVPSFYDMAMISLQPYYAKMWLGDAEIKDDGEGCYLTDNFYDKNADGTYVMAQHIKRTAADTSGAAYAEYPYAGPYFIYSFDESSGEVVLMKNSFFKGNYEGKTPEIGRIVYRVLDAEREMIELAEGSLDIVVGISGADSITEAQKIEYRTSSIKSFTYSRAGYGKLGFRCDYGPAQFAEVRRAIAYLIDRPALASDFTGKHGTAVNGPYYEKAWMYEKAVEQGLQLNAYASSVQEAVRELEEGGWIYNSEGKPYESGIRYKRIPSEVIDDYDVDYASAGGQYTVTRVGDYCYMPLVINWFGADSGEFGEYFEKYLENNKNFAAAGIAVYGALGSIETLQEELYQQAVFGNYGGVPTYCGFVFSTKLESSMYDYSFNLTINPDLYDEYSCYFLKDPADIHWLGMEEEAPESTEGASESGEDAVESANASESGEDAVESGEETADSGEAAVDSAEETQNNQ